MKKRRLIAFILVLNLLLHLGTFISFANDDNNEGNINTINNKTIEEIENTNQNEKYGNNVDSSIDINSLLENFLNSNESIKRIGGKDRIETSLLISRFLNERSDKVIIASAKNYADGLAAASITFGEYPVLLVDGSLGESTINEILRLEAKEIIILGGKSSVNEDIEEKLQNISGLNKITRIGGVDRYETAVKISEKSINENLIFASGENFPDALSSTILTINNSDLILTAKNNLSEYSNDLLNVFNGSSINIVGGVNTISDIVFNNIKSLSKIDNVNRLAGSNRFATSVVVAKSNEISSNTIIIASGENFPDVLSASTLSQKLKSPILLVSKNIIDASVINYIKENNFSNAIILGGTNTIADNTMSNIQRLMNGEDVVNNFNPITFKDFVISNGEQKIYSSPDNNSKIITTMKNKRIMKVLEQDESWVKVNYDKYTGWIENKNISSYSEKSFGTVVNKVPYISQLKPVYAPNGCEPTSLLMGLQGKMYTVIGLRAFLDNMPRHSINPAKGYVGSPYVSLTDGIFQTIDPEPLAKYGQKYGNVVNSHGATVDDIIREIQNGNTVVIYVTLFWKNPVYRSYMIEGIKSTRIWNNHAVLVTGYNPSNSTFYIADPYNHEQAGTSRDKEFYYWKDRKTLERIYNLRRFSITVR